MSLVYITFHDENIRNIEGDGVTEKHFKFPKYISIHRKTVKNPPVNQIEEQGKKVISASRRYSHKTMGYAETPLENPTEFLKKNGGVKWYRVNDHVCPPPRHLPPVPKRSELPPKVVYKKINFIKKNVKRIKSAVPPCIPPKYVDTEVGEKHNLKGTGLIPEYVYSDQFGKPPTYLKAIKKSLEQSYMCQKYMQDNDASRGISVLSEQERNQILVGLKANHAEVEKMYQLLPIFTDTTSKKQRKAKLEQELKRLESQILLMQSNPVILICDD